MNMPLAKAEPATVTPAAIAKVLALPPKRRALATRTATVLGKVAERVVPPVVVIAVALLIWELLCRRAGSTLPPPSRVLSDTWELIIDPFFDRGGLDKGSNLPQRMSSVMNHRSWLWNGYEAKSRQYFMMCGLFSTTLPGMP